MKKQVNLKKILVNELLELTKNQQVPEIVQEQNYSDYKMFLYTLTTSQLLDSIEYEKQDWISKMHKEVC